MQKSSAQDFDEENPLTSKPRRLRDLINAPAILVLPGVFDGFSTRLVQKYGYPAAFVTGSGVSESTMGWADLGVMGFEESVRAVRNLAACSDLPLLADGDTGYGNAVNVHFTVQGYERAGAAGVMIEDQVWPKRCGHMAGKEVIPVDEAAGKIRAACAARKDPDFIIKSRTDALATDSLDEAITRLNVYAEAGADLLFADALVTEDQIRTVAREVTKPLCVNMGFGIRRRSTTPLLSPRQLEDMGVAVVIVARMLTTSAIQGMKNTLDAFGESLKTGKVVERPELLVSFEEVNELMGFNELQEIERAFLPPELLQAKYKG